MHVFFFVVCSLDYPGVGPEHSYLKDLGRAEYHSVTDDEALEGTGLQYICFFVFFFFVRYVIYLLKSSRFLLKMTICIYYLGSVLILIYYNHFSLLCSIFFFLSYLTHLLGGNCYAFFSAITNFVNCALANTKP